MKLSPKALKIMAISVATGGVLLAGSLPALAATNSQPNHPSLVDKIAQNFHLNRDDVQKVVQDWHNEKSQDRRTHLEDKLTQAVKDGKITEAQKTAILQEFDNLSAWRQSLQGKTGQERAEAIKAKRTEVQQWAKDNNIPAPFDRMFLMGVGPMHGHMMHDNQ